MTKKNDQVDILALLRSLSAESDYHTALQSIIALASELTDSEIVSVLRYEEADDCLHFLATPRFHRDALQTLRVPLDESIAGWVYQNASSLVIQDVKGDKRFYSEVDKTAKFQTHSIIAIPLQVKGKTVGVLEAINKTNRAHYNGEDVIILETLASQVALIIENMRLERYVTQMQAGADRLEQMKKDFIAISSHELRTPLGLILGHATFLREVIEEKHHSQLDSIIRSGAKLKDIIENLSNEENFQSGSARIRMEKVAVLKLLSKVVDSYQEMAKEKKIELSLNFKDAELLLEGDAEKIEIVIANLLKNAIIFTPEGGHVSVYAEKKTDFVEVRVVDDGIGIPPEDLEQIFDRFYQVETHLTRQHGGMGLGLSIAKVMVELHGGKIWAESVPGEGSRFIFLLPLDRDKLDVV